MTEVLTLPGRGDGPDAPRAVDVLEAGGLVLLPELPFEGEEEEPTEGPAALPFTGSSTDQLLALGALLSVAGLFLVVTGRRRRTVE